MPNATMPKQATHFQIVQQEIPPLPVIEDKTKIDVRYPLIPPHAYAHIHWDQNRHELVYEVEEPQLTPQEQSLLQLVEEGMEEILNISLISMPSLETIIVYLEKHARIILSELSIKVSEETFLKLMYYLYRDFVGLNEIEPLMRDYFIEDIECNGSDTPLYLVHRKYRNLVTNISFKDPQRLSHFVEKLAQKCGKYISYAQPLLDGRLPDGSRANATYTQEISSRGPTFTIRKFVAEPWSPVKLIQVRTASPEILSFLWLLIEYESNFVVIGSTGTGKTSFLNSLAFFIPPAARIISIEDTRELQLLHENWLPSVAREASGVGSEGKLGEIDMFTLLKESFRQRPDYVIVGEIRGPEAYVLFQGASSGHPTASTLHAEDVETLIRRLETPPINLPPALIETLDVVCTMARVKVKGEEVRRLKEVVEIIEVGAQGGSAKVNTPFVWDPATDTFYFKTNSTVFEKIMKTYGVPKEKLDREFTRRAKLLMELSKRNISGFKEVQEVINAYYKNPDEVLARLSIS